LQLLILAKHKTWRLRWSKRPPASWSTAAIDFGRSLKVDHDKLCGWMTCFSSPRFADDRNWQSFFLRQKSMFRFRCFSPICYIGIHGIKYFSLIFIQLRFLLFVVPLPNIRFLKGEVIPATRRRLADPIRTFRLCPMSSSRPVKKIKLCSLWITYNTMLLAFKNSYFRFRSYLIARHPCKHSIRLSVIDPSGSDKQFLVPLALVFIVTLYIGMAYLMLPPIFISFRIGVIQLNYGHSKLVIEFHR
jgi:hypothetical protein